MSATAGLLQSDDVTTQSIAHTQDIERSSDSVRSIHRHRSYAVRNNYDLPSRGTSSIPCFALSHEAPLCSDLSPPFTRQEFPLFCDFFTITLFPVPVIYSEFGLVKWVQPFLHASPHPSSVFGGNLVLTHGLLSFLQHSAALRQC